VAYTLRLGAENISSASTKNTAKLEVKNMRKSAQETYLFIFCYNEAC